MPPRASRSFCRSMSGLAVAVFAGLSIGAAPAASPIAVPAPADKAAAPPNVVVILADDLGWGDVKCNNPQRGRIATPNIDRLAAEGMRFTDGHSSSGVCSPSRYALLTGRYHWRTRLQTGIVGVWGKPLIAPDRPTIATLLRGKGYATACIGKWHLGWDWEIPADDMPFFRLGGKAGGGGDNVATEVTDAHRAAWRRAFDRPIAGGPTTRGFDRYFGTDVPNWPPYCFIENDRTTGVPSELLAASRLVRNQASLQGPALPGWTLEPILPALATRASEWIAQQAKAGKPFFLYLPLTAPHTPIAVNDAWKGRSGLGAYGDFVMETDAAVGRVLDALRDAGAERDTLVVFTSDNGCAAYIGVPEMEKAGHFPSGPFRGYKADVFEGGHRVPFIVRHPGRVKAGTTCDRLVHHADVFATVAELTGAAVPEGAAGDSFSLVPLLRGEDREVRPTAVSCASSGTPGFRKGVWKYIPVREPGKGADAPEVQLYHLGDDPGERRNLAAEKPDLVAEMKAGLERVVAEGRSTPGPRLANDVVPTFGRAANAGGEPKTPARKAGKAAKSAKPAEPTGPNPPAEPKEQPDTTPPAPAPKPAGPPPSALPQSATAAPPTGRPGDGTAPPPGTLRAPPEAKPSTRKPDIIVILSDDMGFSDIGCYGGEIKTPNLDALAAGGLRFTQFYNTARCCPTRASLLTGLYPHQAGVGHMTGSGKAGTPAPYRGDLDDRSVTIAEALAPAGYRSYLAGKWHVCSNIKDDGPKHNWPRQRGFDRFYGIVSGAGSFFDPWTLCRDNSLISPFADPEYRPARYYFTDAVTDHAVKFVADHARDHGDRPYFLYLTYTAAHWPMHALPEDIAKYTGRYDAGYEAIRKARFEKAVALGLIDAKQPPAPSKHSWEKVDNKTREAACMEVYAAMVDRMDQGIGRLVAELKRTGRYDNTLILYLQDNGGCAEGMGRGVVKDRVDGPRADKPSLPPLPAETLPTAMVPKQTRDGFPVRQGPGVIPGPYDTYIGYGEAWAAVSNTPFREFKHWVHEGGISTPLIAHWPAGITDRGALRTTPGHLIDILPTCLEAAGASFPTRKPDGNPATRPEGAGLLSVFAGRPLPARSLYWEHEGNRAVRTGDWKLVAKGPAGKWELYDLATDRVEGNDLAAAQPDRVKAMAADWETWAKRTGTLPWVWTPAYGESAPADGPLPKKAGKKAAKKKAAAE